eukprot:UN10557
MVCNIGSSCFILFINDILFYWLHRLFHEIPYLYKMHKQHHKFYTTTSVAAEFAHPVEGLTSNFIPTVFGPLLWGYLYGIHLYSYAFYMICRLWETTEVHSGLAYR